MFTFLKRLRGVDADEAVKKRDEQLAALDRQGAELDKLMAQMAVARSAAAIRIQSGQVQQDKLRMSTGSGGGFRLKLDSNPVGVK